MRVTRTLFASACPAALLALSMTPALAQSTGTQDVETVVVTGIRVNINGLMNAAPVAKERSVVTSEFLNTQTSGQTVFQALNFMPGIIFTNNDPYGASGGDIRMHGQDGNHISLTLDGMPLNDTGNYAIYTNQMLDPEVVDRVSALQGATDVDSPTAAATGGVINIVSDKPTDDMHATASLSAGSFDRQRYLVRVDSGKFGPWDTTAFASLSYQDYDKFKGPGHERKIQGNIKFDQEFGDIGWFTLAAHWNSNRNDSYYSEDYLPVTSTTNTTVDIINGPGGFIANPAWTQSTSTSAYTFNDSGWNRDYAATCVANKIGSNTGSFGAMASGQVDFTNICGGFYKLRINPSDTGNIRFHSLWHLLPSLTVTADANLQYVLANGGGYSAISETDARLKGNTTGTGTTTTPFGCIKGVGCDLNGDGDVKDTVGVYSPSTTNTRRWGFSTSLIYQLTDNQTFQLAYTLDYGLHRQTGQMAFFDMNNGPWDPFAGLKDRAHAIVSADGLDLRGRDRKSKAIMNQVAFDWEGKWLDGMVETSLGLRDPFFERDLNQYCYEQVGSSSVLCTSAPMGYTDPTLGYVTVASNGTGTKYVVPGKAVKRYNRFLPHTGVTFLPFGKEHQFFATYVQEMAAPRTDNLYVGGIDPKSGKYNIVASSLFADGNYHTTLPETSASYQLGYRFMGEDLQAAIVLWNSQVKNRIVSSYDPGTGTYFDHNVPGVNFSGIDFEANYRILESLTVYANAGYDRARITTNIQVSQTCSGTPSVCTPNYAQTLNKQLSETPKWEFTGRVTYDVYPELKLGVEGKWIGKRNMTEDNNAWVPSYMTYGIDATFDLDDFGMTGSSLRFNADNIFNKRYFGSIAGTQTCWSTMSGCTSLPYTYEGSPAAYSVTLVATY